MKTLRLLAVLAVVLFTTTIRIYAQYEFVYAPKLQSEAVELGKIKANIASLIQKVDYVIDNKTKLNFFPRDFLVQNDRIEFKRGGKSVVIYFYEMANYGLSVQKHSHATLLNSGITKTDYIVNIENLIQFWFLSGGFDYAKSLADDLFAIQYQINLERRDSLINLFKPVAAEYRELKVKPLVSEELRKYIVQAETSTQEKEYKKAIELYRKAIQIDQTAYPAAYSNLALLYAQVNAIGNAIYHMKKYLLLVPEAEDARSAQDKIYGWELKFQK
jgi:tetratricopeptide (TPR) repeat protein